MAQPKFSYYYKIIKGIHAGEELFLPKRKGDNFVKLGYAEFISKYELANDPETGGTILRPVKKK